MGWRLYWNTILVELRVSVEGERRVVLDYDALIQNKCVHTYTHSPPDKLRNAALYRAMVSPYKQYSPCKDVVPCEVIGLILAVRSSREFTPPVQDHGVMGEHWYRRFTKFLRKEGCYFKSEKGELMWVSNIMILNQ